MAHASQPQRQSYRRLVEKHRPKTPVLRNTVTAFGVGGAITTVGQVFYNYFVAGGMHPVAAADPTAGIIIFLGALFTGFGLYDMLGDYAGMGAALPISGFANAIVSPAIGFKREGYVLGVGSQMFAIAGPVIVYGVVTSFVVGVLYMTANGLL